MQTPVDTNDNRSGSKQFFQSTALEIQHDRGVIYVYGNDSSPLLKITGLPIPIPDCHSPAGRQLTIEIVGAGINCAWAPRLESVSQPHEAATAGSPADREFLLKQAGATIVASGS